MASSLRTSTEQLISQLLASSLISPVVDLGGAGQHEWLASLIGDNFETWDILPGPEIARQVNICHMPEVPANHVGSIVSVAVLEHVSDPWTASKEMVRILMPGGILFCMVPFSYPYHAAPEDYWRFSPQALRVLFKDHCQEFKCDWIDYGQPLSGAYFYGCKKDTG